MPINPEDIEFAKGTQMSNNEANTNIAFMKRLDEEGK